jgi:bacterioferritin
MNDFVINVSEIRKRARQHIEDGAVTPGYRPNRELTLKILNESLATEMVCAMRYRLHYQMASGIHSENVAAEFLEHAEQEWDHANRLADRIAQLNGKPNYNPVGLAERSHTDYVECSDLLQMIKENLIAERIVIDLYGEIIRFLGNDDPTTRRLLESILKEEEEHADELAKMLPMGQAHVEHVRKEVM